MYGSKFHVTNSCHYLRPRCDTDVYASLYRLKNLYNKAIYLMVLVVSNNSIKAQEDLRRDYDYVDSPYRVFDILAFHY